MDPNWLLDQFGSGFFWVSLVIVFVECGLFFPFLPGDTLLFAMGLFIAADKIDVVPGSRGRRPARSRCVLLIDRGAFAGNVRRLRDRPRGRPAALRSTTAGSSSASTSTRPPTSSTSTATRRW